MLMATPIPVTIFEDSGAYLMSRVLAGDGAAAVQADISSIAYSVYDLDDTSSPSTGTLTVSNVVYDTLQTDVRWTKDSTGYNFGWSAPASLFATGDRVYEVEVACTPASGEVFHLRWDVTVKPIRRS